MAGITTNATRHVPRLRLRVNPRCKPAPELELRRRVRIETLLANGNLVSWQLIEVEEKRLASLLEHDFEGQVLTVLLYTHAELFAKFASLNTKQFDLDEY